MAACGGKVDFVSALGAAAAALVEDGVVARVHSAMRSVQSNDRACPMMWKSSRFPNVSAVWLVKAGATAVVS